MTARSHQTDPSLAEAGRPRDAHAFDFLHGHWRVAHRRLKQRHVGSDDWDRFGATSTCEPRLGGLVNVEEIAMPERGFSGVTLRSFDLATGLWSIWWISSLEGRLRPPVTGGFHDGVGTFEGDDIDGGRPIRARYVWSDITPGSARWTQSFSLDGGGTWEANWVMDFKRTEAGA
jgi:hypothetical protein